jgi:hypothetical protein
MLFTQTAPLWTADKREKLYTKGLHICGENNVFGRDTKPGTAGEKGVTSATPDLNML